MKQLKRIFDFITNKDVTPDDIPYYCHIKEEHLKNGQIEVLESDNEIIEEVFEYNARAVKSRITLLDIAEVKKGYFKVNLAFIFLSFVVMFIYECTKKEGFVMNYGYPAIGIFAVVYIYSRFFKKFNIYINVLSSVFLVVVSKVFVIAIIANIILGYMYDRTSKRIKEELGYPNFPSIDLILCCKNGQYKKIFAKDME